MNIPTAGIGGAGGKVVAGGNLVAVGKSAAGALLSHVWSDTRAGGAWGRPWRGTLVAAEGVGSVAGMSWRGTLVAAEGVGSVAEMSWRGTLVAEGAATRALAVLSRRASGGVTASCAIVDSRDKST